jgi:5'-3' exonuclease
MHLVVDANYLLRRSFHVKSLLELRSPDGIRTGGLFGLLRSVRSTLSAFGTVKHCTCVFDGGLSERRQHLYPQYKQKKKVESTPEDTEDRQAFLLQKQYSAFALSKLGCRVIQLTGKEADDVIGYLCKQKPFNELALIMSDDNDMLQLVSQSVSVYRPMHDEEVVTPINFEGIAGVPLNKFLTYKALLGDSSDNIEGIPGIGPKSAQEILKNIDLEGVHPDLYEMRNFLLMHKKKAFKKAGVRVQEVVPLNFKLMDISLEEFTTEQASQISTIMQAKVDVQVTKVAQLFDKLGFTSMTGHDEGLSDLSKWIVPFHYLT